MNGWYNTIMNSADIQAQYVLAVMENRLATAHFLYAQLQPVELNMVCPPEDNREVFSCHGTLVIDIPDFDESLDESLDDGDMNPWNRLEDV